MDVTLSGSVREVRAVPIRELPSSIVSLPRSGRRFTLARLRAYMKAPSGRDVAPPISTLVSFSAYANAQYPALSKPSGNVSEVRCECVNACEPIVRNVEGIVTVATCAFSKADCSMVVVPSRTA